MRLREEQDRLVERDITAALRRHRLAAVYSPTAFGKGWVIAVLAARTQRKAETKGRVQPFWIITPQAHLVADLSRRLSKLGIPHGKNAGGFRKTRSHPVQIFTNVSIGKLLAEADELLESGEILEPALVCFDEAHYDLEGQRRFFAKFRKTRGLGFSGSPIGMGAVYSELALGPGINELTLMRRLVPLVAYECKPVDPALLRPKNSDADGDGIDLDYYWAQALKRGQIVGDIAATYRTYCQNRHTLVRTGSQKYAEMLTLMLNELGLQAAYINSGHTVEQRDGLIADFSRTPGSLLVFADVLTQGADIVRADTLIPAAPTQSLRIFAQGPGRIMRPIVDEEDNWALDAQGQPLKEFALLLDHAGWINTHGLIYHYEPEDWAELFHTSDLEDDPERRIPARSKERIKNTFRCDICAHVYEGQRKCPRCGAFRSQSLSAYDRFGPKLRSRAFSAISGELQPVGRDISPKLLQERRDRYAELRGYFRWRLDEELLRTGIHPTYKSGKRRGQPKDPDFDSACLFRQSYSSWPPYEWRKDPHKPLSAGTRAWLKNKNFTLPKEEVSA